MIEFNLHGEKIKIRKVAPGEVAENGFVETIVVDYCLEIPDLVDGEGAPTTLHLGVCDTITVSNYKPEGADEPEFIPFENLSESYFYGIAQSNAATSQGVLDMIAHAKSVQENKIPSPSSPKIRRKFFKT